MSGSRTLWQSMNPTQGRPSFSIFFRYYYYFPPQIKERTDLKWTNVRIFSVRSETDTIKGDWTKWRGRGGWNGIIDLSSGRRAASRHDWLVQSIRINWTTTKFERWTNLRFNLQVRTVLSSLLSLLLCRSVRRQFEWESKRGSEHKFLTPILLQKKIKEGWEEKYLGQKRTELCSEEEELRDGSGSNNKKRDDGQEPFSETRTSWSLFFFFAILIRATNKEEPEEEQFLSSVFLERKKEIEVESRS